MKYWFASIKSLDIPKNRFTSLEKAENYQQDQGGIIETVPVYNSEEAVANWIQEQDNPSQYYVMSFSEDSQSCNRQPYV